MGRFLSADPHITDPRNGQNYNRYSYVLNNPTNLGDPTGFDIEISVCGTSTRDCDPEPSGQSQGAPTPNPNPDKEPSPSQEQMQPLPQPDPMPATVDMPALQSSASTGCSGDSCAALFSQMLQPGGVRQNNAKGGGWTASGVMHGVLTAGSFCPSICGSAISAIDGLAYAAEGDTVSAGISLAAAAVGVFREALQKPVQRTRNKYLVCPGA